MPRKLAYVLLSIGIAAAWQYASDHFRIARLLISSPALVAGYVAANGSDVLLATATTFVEATLGLIVASGVSFGILILCFYRPRVMQVVLPFMVVSQVIPLIVLAPFFVIAIGIGITSKVAMAALLCFFPTFVNAAQGYRAIDQNVHDMLQVYGTPTRIRIVRAYLPLALPNIMAGLKLSATLSVIGAIVAEFTGAAVGLGKNLFLSAIRLEPDLMMVSLLCAALLGGTMYGMIHMAERRFGHWYLG